MCGIIGLLPFGKLDAKQEKIRQEVMMYLGTELLQLTQTRGKDATGVSVMFENGAYMGLKMGVSAIEFVSRFGGEETDFEGFMKLWRNKGIPAKAFLGHCRKPSAGKITTDNNNNHPIKVGDIIGIHNGTISNDEIIFKNLKREPNGDVDSEAIFQLLHYLTDNGANPFTLDMLDETCKRLEGSYACLAFNGNNPFQVVAFRDSKPIEIALLRPLKLVIIASDSDFIKTALFRLNIMANVYNYGVNFPTIHKSDIDMRLLPDDSVYLFDLTKEINMNTFVMSTYESKKVNRLEKIWKSKKNNYSGYYDQTNMYKQNNIDANNQKKAEVNAVSAELPGDNIDMDFKHNDVDENHKEDKHASESFSADKVSNTNGMKFRKALVWNKFSKNFEKASISSPIKKEVVNALSSIIVNIETDSIVTVDEEIIRQPKKDEDQQLKKDEDFNLSSEETQLIPTKENENSAVIEVVETIPVNIIKDQEEKKRSDESPVQGTSNSRKKEEIREEFTPKKQIDMITLSPLAIESAVEATNSIERFSTDNDVCQALNIHNYDNLKSLPIYSLANRVIKYITEKAFLIGWKAAIQDPTLLNVIHDKQEKAEQGIRTSKILINFVSKIIMTKKIQLFDDEQITKMFWEDKKINLEMIQKVFSIKDLNKNEMLGQVQAFLINKKKEEL